MERLYTVQGIYRERNRRLLMKNCCRGCGLPLATLVARKLAERDSMLDRQELSDLARELSLALNVVEKDYVLDWLLSGIAANKALD